MALFCGKHGQAKCVVLVVVASCGQGNNLGASVGRAIIWADGSVFGKRGQGLIGGENKSQKSHFDSIYCPPPDPVLLLTHK